MKVLRFVEVEILNPGPKIALNPKGKPNDFPTSTLSSGWTTVRARRAHPQAQQLVFRLRVKDRLGLTFLRRLVKDEDLLWKVSVLKSKTPKSSP